MHEWKLRLVVKTLFFLLHSGAMVILYSTRLRSVKHLIDRVLELQDDEAKSPKIPEIEEDPDLENLLRSLQPKIRVFGCGGCGSNTVARLEQEGLFDDEYVKGMAVNTDAQHLSLIHI